MRWTAHEPGRHKAAVALGWAIMAALPLFTSPAEFAREPAWSRAVGGSLFAALGVGLIWVTSRVFLTSATIAEGTITLRALRRQDRLSVPLEEVVGYHMDKSGAWWVHTRPEGTTCREPSARTRVVVSEPWELHRAFVDLAPKKLGGRRWRFQGVPPAEEFRGLWTFDVDRYAARALPQLAGVLTGVLLGFLLTHRPNVGAMGQPLGIVLILGIEVWGRLDVTDEGLVRRSPTGRQIVRWDEARAIFRETRGDRRSFVVVGPECAIEIPAHIALDQDVMEKIFYSLADPILCVNFDETTFRGYRRRNEAKRKVPQEDLMPALTA